MDHITTIGQPKYSAGRPKLLPGQKWNFLTILSEAGSNKLGSRLVKCQCDCGKIKTAIAYHVRAGRIVSCGCYPRQMRRGHRLGYWRKSRKGAKTPEEAARRNLYVHYKTKAKQFKRIFDITETEFFDLTLRNCHYCGSAPSRVHCRNIKAATVCKCLFNGIDRLDSSTGYTRDNVVSCCWICNTAKNSMTPYEFKCWIERVYRNFVTKQALT